MQGKKITMHHIFDGCMYLGGYIDMNNGEIIAFPGKKTKLTEDMAAKNVEERLAQIEGFVLKNPAKSLAIALMAGMFLGLLGRRS